jgi:predicted GNAT superfamily acetyltransferase
MIQVRSLSGHDEFRAAVHLQREIWGFDEVELLPVRLFVVATKVGGQAFGAFDDSDMVGFCIAIPGLKPGGKTYLHSHMLGVLPEYRDRGIGRLLKLEQRREALSRGIDLVEWTFDPLELRNAFFNIERLGAVVRRYVLNQYGNTTSPLHGGMPTDRCVAEWRLASARVEAVLAGGAAETPPIEARIEIPADIALLRAENPQRARDIQKTVSESFLRHLDKGLAAVGFERSEHAGTYLLAPWQ